VGGVTYARDSYLDVCRYPGQHAVSPLDVDRLVPGWLDALPPEHREDQGRRLIQEAFTEVDIDLHEIGVGAENIRHTDIMAELVKRKAVCLAQEAKLNSGGTDISTADYFAKIYEGRLNKLVRVVNKTPTSTTSGAATVRKSVGLWSK
jgi:hypothetical protein